MAGGILKRRASSVMKGWDNKTRDALLQRMVSETMRSVQRDDPAHSDWCTEGQELNVWVDTSFLAIGEARSSVGGCLLAASRERCPTYQPC